jgi:hypothetical protein
VRKARLRFETPDGRVYHYRADPAKGTVNQLALGYATLLLVAGDDLPPAARRRAREDLGALALHLIHHGYTLRELDGRRTPYGWLKPRFFFRYGVPFNAQVSYAIVAAARAFPPDRGEQRRVLEREHARLRREHPYWEPLWKPPFVLRPQRVARSRFLGHNDLNHVVNAAYLGVLLELEGARREGRPPDARFLRRLGETLRASGPRLERTRQALGALMWVALLDRPALREALDVDDRAETRRALLEVALEQLRRFPLDRFVWEGRNVRSDQVQWVDAYRPDSYHWKVEPTLAWETTGGPGPMLISAIDYLHAYWLLRHHGIETDLPEPTSS